MGLYIAHEDSHALYAEHFPDAVIVKDGAPRRRPTALSQCASLAQLQRRPARSLPRRLWR